MWGGPDPLAATFKLLSDPDSVRFVQMADIAIVPARRVALSLLTLARSAQGFLDHCL